MLDEISPDWSVLVPGETVAIGKRSTIVWPLALVHFKTRPAEVNAIFGAMAQDAEEDPVQAVAAAVARVLVTTGFKLLSDCCIPVLDGPQDPLTPAAASAWAAASIDMERFNTQDETEDDGTGNVGKPPTFRLALSRLIAAGHRAADVLQKVQPGAPYPGWTLQQFHYWLRANDSRRARDEVEHAQSAAMAISGTVGGNDDGFGKYIESLREI